MDCDRSRREKHFLPIHRSYSILGKDFCHILLKLGDVGWMLFWWGGLRSVIDRVLNYIPANRKG